MIGALGGYAGTSVKDRQDGSSANINSYQVGLYELQRFDSIYVSNIDAYTNSTYDVSRPINIGNINKTASGSSSGNQWSHYSELGTTISFDDIQLQPFAGFQYMYLAQHGYSESGAGSLDLTTGAQNVSSSRGSIGARLSTEMELGRNTDYADHVCTIFARIWRWHTLDHVVALWGTNGDVL